MFFERRFSTNISEITHSFLPHRLKESYVAITGDARTLQFFCAESFSLPLFLSLSLSRFAKQITHRENMRILIKLYFFAYDSGPWGLYSGFSELQLKGAARGIPTL